MTGGEPPGVSNIVKMGKNIFAKFEVVEAEETRLRAPQ
jgi:hypothetical protein